MGIKLIIFDLAFVCASRAPEFSLTSNLHKTTEVTAI